MSRHPVVRSKLSQGLYDRRTVLVLALVTVLLVFSAVIRSFELDEGYSLLLLDGLPRLNWPTHAFSRPEVADWFERQSRIQSITSNLRHYDVHPPLWFFAEWKWRDLFGSGLLAARSLSICLTISNFLVFLAIARRFGAQPAMASAVAFLSYVIIYTGATVRMYPLALLFLQLGVLFLLATLQSRRGSEHVRSAVVAGACFGLGSVTHMLVLFPAVLMCAVTAVFLLKRRCLGAVAALAVTPLPMVAWASTYFLVQDRRDWQFPPFQAIQMLRRVAQDEAAALLGGTPLYFTGSAQLAVGGLLVLLLLAVAVAVVAALLALRREPEAWVIATGAVAMPCVLFGLGLVFHRQASEPRYMLYGIPFLALLLTRGMSREQYVPSAVIDGFFACLLAAELVGSGGLLFSRSMQQDARPAIAEIMRQWKPGALLLLPEAADTTGMTVDYVFEAPDRVQMALVRHDETQADLLPLLSGRSQLFEIVCADGIGQHATARLSSLLKAEGWHDIGSPGGVASKRGVVWTEFARITR